MNARIITVLVLVLLRACSPRVKAGPDLHPRWYALNQEFIALHTRGDYEQALTVARQGVDLAYGFTPAKTWTWQPRPSTIWA